MAPGSDDLEADRLAERALVTLRSVRRALATEPLRPMTLPMSDSATCSSMTVPSSPLTTSTVTASGSSTRDFATYSTRSAAAIGVYFAAGVMPAFLNRRLTVSLGWAPFDSQSLALASSIWSAIGSVRGL